MSSDSTTYILCIEVSNTVTSVAIGKNGIPVLYKEVLEPNKAADQLHFLIQNLLADSNLSFTDLNAIAISSGPGSYTGLRIASSAAKGYCFALDIPLIAVNTLEAMIYGVQNRYNKLAFDVFIPMIDARRMEVFTSFYTKELECVKSFSSLIIGDEFDQFLQPDKKYLLFGNGAFKTKEFINNNQHIIFEEFNHSALDIVYLSYEKFKSNLFEEIAYFEPNYLKAVYTTSKQLK